METTDWHQCIVDFTDRETAEHLAAHELGPALSAAQDSGLLRRWWYIRKSPWRWRYLPDDPSSTTISDLLDKLAADGRIVGWTPGIYEPETLAFGGEEAMDVAHELFHHDSRHLLTRAASADTPFPGRSESAVVLCSVLLRSAGLDWYEQGDVWAKVAELRPAELCTPGPAPERDATLTRAMRRLMTADTRALCDLACNGPQTGHGEWITAFEEAGQCLADLARRGRLKRGLRAVLAHHVIFHANRAGLPLVDQSALAALALNNVLATPQGSVSSPSPTPTPLKVNQMTTLSDDRSALSAEQLRTDLTDRLCVQNVVRTPGIRAAFLLVPREEFVPGVSLEQVYADNAVYTKADAAGISISAASQPRIVAMMLEQLNAQPGERIFEAGAGTGLNAALMAAIVGAGGHVTTVDVDEDLVDGAREHLAAAGVHNVEVVLGDGALGHPDGAPYDRIIATVGAYETPTAWLEQLAPHGRLVVPLRLRGAASRSIVFERGRDGWRSIGSELAVFMPLRGIGDDARRVVALTPEEDVTLQVHQDQVVDAHALAGVLDTKRHEIWTKVVFPPMVPYEWMDLWLACRLGNALMRMSVQSTAVDRGQVTPMFGWGSMATTQGRDLAYLTVRPAPPAEDGGKLYEVGVIGHGPTGQDLAQQVAQEVLTWDAHYRTRSVQFEIPDTPDTPEPAGGRFVLPRPHHPITVIWE